MRRALSLVALLALAGCPKTAAPSAVAEHATVPAMLARPFTPEQIRAAFVPGLQLTLSAERDGVPAPAPVLWEVVSADEVGMRLSARDGVDGEPEVSTYTWAELADHASFPASRATRVRHRRESVLGPVEGWMYTIQGDAGSEVDHTLMFFADAAPGPPLWMATHHASGTVFTMTQTRREVVPQAAEPSEQ